MKQIILAGYVLFFVVIIGERNVECCPDFNVSMNQILEGNPYLRSVYDELGPLGFLSADGLRDLVTKLLNKTCPLKPEMMRMADLEHGTNHAKEHGNDDYEDHEHSHADHNHDNHEDDHIDHDHKRHETDKTEDHIRISNHNPKGDHSADDNDHGALIDLPKQGDKKMLENMISLETSKTNHKIDEHENNNEENSQHGTEVSVDTSVKNKICNSIEDILSRSNFEKDNSLRPEDFLHICPAILNTLLGPPCQSQTDREGLMADLVQDLEHGYDHQGHNHHHRHEKGHNGMTRDSWFGAVLSLILIGFIAFCCIMVIPVLKKSRYYVLINHFLLALAVGSLAGDALIHLLPHAMTMKITMSLNGHLVHALYGFTAFLGILLFLLLERAHDLFGHKHSHGHSHDTSATVDGDEFIKEIGIISAELNETSTQRFDKIGEKLSQHSKHSSFVFAESNTSPSDPPRSCFESCPPNLGAGLEDANGNNGNIDSMVCKPRVVDHNSGSVAECERLVNNSQSHDKNEQICSSKTVHATIPPPPLVVQSSPPKSLVRQDSNNFNMVLQEYHVGHHGHSHHGHSHVTGKKDSLRTMILLGDGIHCIMDGMAIGAAFGTSLTGGIATAIAVLCHELPHKVGDFAILFEMGMKRRQAVKMVIVLWLLSLLGMAVGVSIGSIQEVSPWIYCFTAGVFLYLALVDLLSELSINDTAMCSEGMQMLLQIAGMTTGALIMLLIAIYEHDLEHLLDGSF